MKIKRLTVIVASVLVLSAANSASAQIADAHFHISNYIGQGGTLKQVLQFMNNSNPDYYVPRTTIMPIPLAQKYDAWDNYTTEPKPPTYYIGPRSQLYYYSFIDAMVAAEYNRLTDTEKDRFDLMITAFNPMDMYAVQHIKRVLLTYPGMFSGIGEFTIHKEVVSDKLPDPPVADLVGPQIPEDIHHNDRVTLFNPSLKKIFDFAAESGLVVMLHNDIYHVKVKHDGAVEFVEPNVTYVSALKQLCASSPEAKIIWAHTGLGRFVAPAANHLTLVADVLKSCKNWSTDISWDLVQKYITKPQSDQPSYEDWRTFLAIYQDRVLFGSDNVFYKRAKFDEHGAVIPGERQTLGDYIAVQQGYAQLWQDLGPTVAKKIKYGNYEALFNGARTRVRSWETAHKNDDVWSLPPP